jgi:hypothetical protein
VVKPFIASRNAEKINEREILADVGRDMTAMSAKINAEDKKEAGRQRNERTRAYYGQSAKSTTPNDAQPAPQESASAARHSSDAAPAETSSNLHAVIHEMVAADRKASEDHGMIASIRGGAAIYGNLPPLSETVGPLMRSTNPNAGPVDYFPVGLQDLQAARSKHEGQDFSTTAPIFNRNILYLNKIGIRAVLGPDGTPIMGKMPDGQPAILFTTPPDAEHPYGEIAGYMLKEDFDKLEAFRRLKCS